ncbi:MAG: hypothetical protein WDM90_01095 [Ferruginibacter sp.]
MEKKISKLKLLCSAYESTEFLTFLAGVLLQIPQRKENPYLKNLMSPMRQLFFLGLLNLQRDSSENKKGFNEAEWDEITKLMHEIEMEYFFLLGFPKDGKETPEDIEKIRVTMPTFMNYFFNGPLSYQEQEIEKLEGIFLEFEAEFKAKWDLGIADFIECYELINNAINKNLNTATKFVNPETWQEFTSKCIAKGLLDPKDWVAEAPEEINAFMNFIKNPGSFLVINLNKMDYTTISKEKVQKIIELFTCERRPNAEIVYYTEENSLINRPILETNKNEYLIFYLKQYLDSVYNFLFKVCAEIDRTKIYSNRDIFIENKTANIFQEFFGKDAFMYTNYSIDNNTSEQDILVICKRNAVIIEVKAAGSRAPMRDPVKAYEKLKSDFKKSIQYGYDQTFRVKNKFIQNEKITITDAKKKILYEFNSDRYENAYSIVVTLDRFGHIQTNLAEMLEKNEDDDFPWAVNIDDLEAFLLTLGKRKNKIQSFFSFLQFRQNFHGHLLCGDELELCGLFLKDEKDFREWSLKDESIVTQADLTEPIEKAYSEGMGFRKERFGQQKKDKTINVLFDKK